jgi:RimJ/RimL family protein N-acetyltransferase
VSAPRERAVLVWERSGLRLVAVEPDDAMVREHATTLTRWYTDEENASMMGGSTTMTEEDTRAYWADLRAKGGRGFLYFVDGVLTGDSDLRSLGHDPAVGRYAEFAIMIGEGASKGRGLGRALAEMVHVFAFRELGLARVYGQPKPENTRVRRLEASIGYVRDESPLARSLADDDAALTASVTPEAFRARCAAAWHEVAARYMQTTHSSGSQHSPRKDPCG